MSLSLLCWEYQSMPINYNIVSIACYHGTNNQFTDFIFVATQSDIIMFDKNFNQKILIKSFIQNYKISNIYIRNDVIYICDSCYNQVIKLTIDGDLIEIFHDIITPRFILIDSKKRIIVSCNNGVYFIDQTKIISDICISDMTIDNLDYLHIANSKTYTIDVYDLAGKLIRTYASSAYRLAIDKYNTSIVICFNSLNIYDHRGVLINQHILLNPDNMLGVIITNHGVFIVDTNKSKYGLF